jgi:hypothetical protein
VCWKLAELFRLSTPPLFPFLLQLSAAAACGLTRTVILYFTCFWHVLSHLYRQVFLFDFPRFTQRLMFYLLHLEAI